MLNHKGKGWQKTTY